MARVRVSVIVATHGAAEPSPGDIATAIGDQTLPATQYEIVSGVDRNAGIVAARGDYLLFLDSRDQLGVDSLEHLARFGESDDLDIVDVDGRDAPQLYRRRYLLECDLRFVDDHPFADLDFATRAALGTHRVGVFAGHLPYPASDHDDPAPASLRALSQAIERAVTSIVTDLAPGVTRDQLLARWYRRGVLAQFGPRYAQLAPAGRERLTETVSGLVPTFPTDIDRRLTPAERARSALLRAGNYDALQSLSRADTGLQLLCQQMTATWHDGNLHLAVNGVLADRAASPLRFGRSGDAVVRVLPPELHGTGADTVDLVPHAARASGEFIVRARAAQRGWVLPSTSTLEFVRSGVGASDDLFLRFAIESRLDPRGAAGGRRLDDDVWDVFCRVDRLGWTGPAAAPAPELVPPPALVDDISLVPYRTKGDTFAVDVGDSITTAVAFAGPRLVDAVNTSAAHEPARTRVALPDLHTAGRSNICGSVSIGARVVPARLTGSNGSADLVVDTARLATNRTVRAQFGGRWSAALFASELAALAAIRTASAKTPKRVADALRILPASIDDQLTASDQVRLAHARAGNLEALAAFNRTESGLRMTARETRVSWEAGRLRITVLGVLTESGGAPVRFRDTGTAVVRMLPAELAAPAVDRIDIRPDLTAATGAIGLRARESNSRWSVLATVQLAMAHERAKRSLRRDLHLLCTLDAWLDPESVADGVALGEDVWDVSYRVDAPGWTTTTAAVPAPDLDRPTALVNGVRLVLYPTQRDSLAIDTGDKIRTLVGYALPRLADATVNANGGGAAVTRIDLPNTYVCGDTELVGTLTVDERDVPARIVGSNDRAVLVAETARLARAEAISATFGGRESFPLFAFELSAGRGVIAGLGIALVAPARRLRARAQRIIRRVRPRPGSS